MDAALDAVTQMGYPKKLVRDKMIDLLKDDLLEDEMVGDQAALALQIQDDLLEDEMVGDQDALVTVVPSGENVEPEGSQTPNTTTQNNRRAQGDENSWIDIVYDQTTGSQDMRIVEATDHIGGEYSAEDVNLLDPQDALVTVVPSGENVEPEGSQTPNTTTQNNRRAQGDENSWIDIVYDQTTGSQDMRIVEATDHIGGEYSAEDVNLLDPQDALVTVVPSGENVEPEGSQTPNTTTQNNRRAQGDENSWIDIVYDQTTGSQDMRIVEATDHIGGEYSAEDVNLLDPPPNLVAGSSAEQQTARKRKPCYGWIGDGEEDDNFVILTPAVAPM